MTGESGVSERASAPGSARSRPSRGVATRAIALDAVAVIVFAGIGRLSHGEGPSLGGLLRTAGPFLAGALLAWLVVVSRGWAPYAWRTGLLVLAGVVVVGMLLRVVLGQGTAPSFILVATLFNALLLLGWRLLARRRTP